MRVIDGQTRFEVTLEQYRAAAMVGNGRRQGVEVKPMTAVVDAEPLLARVRQNRWCCLCPHCAGAEFVWLAEPLFMCQSCWNAAVGGLWYRVKVPRHVRQIEAALEARPLSQNRNWEPRENVKDLWAENEAHGIVR